MPRAYEVLSGFNAAPTGGPDVWTMATGDSATVRNATPGSDIRLENAWGWNDSLTGILRIRSPRLHDFLQGIRLGFDSAYLAVPGALPVTPLFADAAQQRLESQDTLTIDMFDDGAASVEGGTLLVSYADLPGSAARLSTWQEVAGRIVDLVSVETQHTTGATAGDYGGEVAINSFEDVLKANRDYAVLGYTVQTAGATRIATVGYRSADFANYRLGGPGTVNPQETRDWFARRSSETGEPWVPIFNAANKFNTLVDLIDTGSANAVSVFTMLALLA